MQLGKVLPNSISSSSEMSDGAKETFAEFEF